MKMVSLTIFSTNYDLLESLPVNGYLPEAKSVGFDSDELDFDSDVNESTDLGPMNSDENVYNEHTEMGSFLPGNLNSNKEKVIINNEVLSPQTHELTLGSDPLNEFNREYLASLCFPTLSPDTKDDPTNSCLLRNISKSETESFAAKIKHLIKFGEKIDGKWVYRFASHPRFACWACNTLYRKRLLGQGNYF